MNELIPKHVRKKLMRLKAKLTNFWHLFASQKQGLIGIYIILFFAFWAIAPSLFAPFDPAEKDPQHSGVDPSAAPSWRHILGRDTFRQDIFSRIIHGAWVSFLVGMTSVAVSSVIGTIIGIVSGFYRGIVDDILMRITDIVIIIPGLPLLIVLATVVGRSIWNIILILGFLGWTGLARLVRSQVFSLREMMFVEAARAAGASDNYLMFRHILPHTIPVISATLILGISGAIFSESALSFLGLGPLDVLSWGRVLDEAQRQSAMVIGWWWWITFPGLAITMIMIGFTLIGNAMYKIVNPKLAA